MKKGTMLQCTTLRSEPSGSDYLMRNAPLLKTALTAAAGLLAGGAGLAAFNRSRSEDAETNNPPPGEFMTVDGVRLHYVSRGSGQPLVLLHGNGSMVQDWMISGVLDQLAATHRVIAFDRPGFGYSERPNTMTWTPQAQADLLAKAISQLGIEQPVVVAHSFATQVALALALRHRGLPSRLVLISGYYYPTARMDVPLMMTPALPLVGGVLRHTISPVLAKAILPLANRSIFSPAPVPQKWKDEFPFNLLVRPSQLRAAAEDSGVMIPAARALSPDYGSLHLPTTIIAGDGDKIADAETHSVRLDRELPNSRLTMLEGIGHMAHQIAPEAVVKAINAPLPG